jgi:hypothetical protein
MIQYTIDNAGSDQGAYISKNRSQKVLKEIIFKKGALLLDRKPEWVCRMCGFETHQAGGEEREVVDTCDDVISFRIVMLINCLA